MVHLLPATFHYQRDRSRCGDWTRLSTEPQCHAKSARYLAKDFGLVEPVHTGRGDFSLRGGATHQRINRASHCRLQDYNVERCGTDLPVQPKCNGWYEGDDGRIVVSQSRQSSRAVRLDFRIRAGFLHTPSFKEALCGSDL